MAREGKSRARAATPPPLPPERRTIGQLIAETIRLYGAHFLASLPLGLVVAVVNQLAFEFERAETTLVFVVAAPVFTLAYVHAARLATGARTGTGAWVVALGVGIVLFLPAAFTFAWFALASVLWLGLVGLAVPAAVAEGTSFTGSIRRGLQLGRADYVHAAGSLAALVILFALSRQMLALLLESQAENTVRTAVFLADTVLAPLLFLGGALLYVDQEARLRSRHDRGKERDADVPDADETDGEGRPDAARESGPAA
jgi:hypothetical protein